MIKENQHLPKVVARNFRAALFRAVGVLLLHAATAEAGVGKNLEACQKFYGPSEVVPADMLQSGMFGVVEQILARNPGSEIHLFRESRPFGLLGMGVFLEGKGEMFTYMRVTEAGGMAGTSPLSDAEVETLLVLNQSGGAWKKQENGVVEPVKKMWVSGDGRYTAAYNDTGAMRALNIVALKLLSPPEKETGE